MIPYLQVPPTHTLASFGILVLLAVLEVAGQRVVVLLGVAWLVVVDAVLFAEVGSAGGLFRVSIPSGSIDLSTAAVFTVVAVRALVRLASPPGLERHARRVAEDRTWLELPVAVLLWAGLVVWLAFSGIRGYLAGHPASNVAYQELGLLQVAAAAVLIAGVRLDHLQRQRRLLVGSCLAAAAIAGGLVVTAAAGIDLTRRSPLLPYSELGTVGGDAATVFGLLALATLAFGLRLPEFRGRLLLAAVPLSVVPFASTQRAALLGWGIGIAILLVVFAVAQGSRQPWMPALQVQLAAVAVVVGLLGLVAAQVSGATTALGDPFSKYVGIGKQQSQQSRLNQWTAAEQLFLDSPLIGSGLGTQYEHYEVGGRRIVVSDITHNIGIDVAVRGGAVGVAILALAALSSVVTGVRRALSDTGGRAGAALAAAAGLAALLTKGSVESVFEKPRLTVALGLLIGLLAVAASSPARRPGRPGAALLAPRTTAVQLTAQAAR